MSQSICFHCGLPVAAADQDPIRFPIHYRQAVEAACCAGCQAVAATIIESGLDSYYASREHVAGKAEPLPEQILSQLKYYDTPEMQAGFVKQEEGAVREAALILEGITCAACIWLNERHLMSLPGVLEAGINYTTHRARVRWNNDVISLSAILESIAAIGYRAHPYDPGRQDALHQKERKAAINRLWIAGLSMMQVMMYVVPVYLAGPGTISNDMLGLMRWASLVLTLPVVLYSCQPFHKGVWRDLKRHRVGMDMPVVIGVWAAFIASIEATVTGRGEVYFDSVSMFVFLLLGGRYLEGMARRRAGEAAETLIKLVPAFAHGLKHWPASRETVEIPVAQLKVDDFVLVLPGEHFPSDGVVVEGEGHADEALMTGESRPIAKVPGEAVIGGAINLDSPIIAKVSKIGQETQLAAMVRLLDRALADKPELARIADAIAAWFVAALLIVAGAGWLWWHLHDPARALPIAVAVLVVSCPCALSLATPAALTAATGRLARAGLLVTRGHALETLAEVTDIVFDKTGTLTHGQPRLIAIHPVAGEATEAHRLAALLEAASEHPIALAIRDGIDTAGLVATDYGNSPGNGVAARIDGRPYRLGTPRYAAELAGDALPPDLLDWQADDTVVWLATEGRWLAGFALGDTVRDEAAQLLPALRQSGQYTLHMVTGDAAGPARVVGKALGIEHIKAHARPQDKLDYVQALQAANRVVLMIGDGVNDAPVLAIANVSAAIGGGADVAQAASDVVLVSGIAALAEGLGVARQGKQVIRQNFAWALAYNLVALPLALAGFLTPWLASLGMAGSSLLVVANALRLAKPNTNHKE